MTLRFLKETTNDWNAGYHVPCHTYIIDNNTKKCIGYIKDGQTTPIMFNNPFTLERRKRTFTTLKKVPVDIDPNNVYDSSTLGTDKSPTQTTTTFLNPRGKFNMSKSKTLNWNDRFALIDHYSPTDDEVCKVFGVTKDELATARNMRNTGVITPTPNLDVASYGKMFGSKDSIVKPTTDKATKTSTKIEKPATPAQPQTASKKPKELKKRGRKGSNIVTAFSAIPSTPVSVEDFAKKQGVSVAVLRQSKRFDTTGMEGRVHVKKDKETKTLMIWRSADN